MGTSDYTAAIALGLQDGVSPVLDKIDQRLADLEGSFKKLEDSGTSAGDKTGASLEAMGTKAVAVGGLLKDAFEAGIRAVEDFIASTYDAVKAHE